MSSLLMVVPSRGRPGNIARLLGAMNATCRGDTHLVVGLDEDDDERVRYPSPGVADGRWAVEVRSGLRRVVPWVNALAVPRADDYDYIGHFGDDNVPRTVGWDVRIMEALKEQPFAFGNDLYPGRAPGELSCHVFTRSEVVKALGYFGPPGIKHMYVDVAWMAWGHACGIAYLDDVVIEHLHYTCGKAVLDQSYWDSTSLMPTDLEAYHAYCRDPDGLNGDILKIAALTGHGLTFNAQAVIDWNNKLNIPPKAREGWVPGDPLW